MATIAFDDPHERDAVQPPLSLHPAFPAIVALWFAALLGVGSLVLPAVLLERAVAASGIGTLFAAANPPLGLTARGLIALAAALAGAGLGLAIARRIALAHAPVPVSRFAQLAEGQRRPISVHDELGGEGVVNGESLPLSRRRALAITEDERPSDFLYRAPLPGAEPDASDPILEAVPGDEDEPLELCELATEETFDEADEDFDMTESRESVWPSHQHSPAEDCEPAEERDSRNNAAGPRGLEPLPFAAPSLARKAAARVEFEPEPEAEAEAEPDVQLEAVPPLAAPANDEPEFRADWETAPLDGLGLVQLVQRLGATIERRREHMAQVAAQSVDAPAVPVGFAPPDFEPAPAEEAVQAMAAFFAPAPEAAEPETADADEPAPAERPAFLRSIDVPDDEDDHDDAGPDFSLPLRRAAAPAAFVPADGDDEDETDDAQEGGYSSLLGLGNPFTAPRTEFVRIDEPAEEDAPAEPAVVFPGQLAAGRPFDAPGSSPAPAAAAQAPADAEAALRAALATLQRMSGAA